MSLFRRGNCRGTSRGKRDVNRRSLADLLNLDTSADLSSSGPSQSAVAPTVSQHHNDVGGEGLWRWNASVSPEVAQTPRALVPPDCFPPSHSMDFASHSESAQRPVEWREDLDSSQITSLATSFDSMQLPSTSISNVQSLPSVQTSFGYDRLERMDGAGNHLWPNEQAGTSVQDEPQHLWPNERAVTSARHDQSKRDNRSRYLARRASFGGATSTGNDVFGLMNNTILVWEGILPPRCADPDGGFSVKVFLGGLPWDITEQALLLSLKSFRPIRVEWPGRENGGSSRGYAYVTFENERGVRALLAASRCDGKDWYFRIAVSRKIRNKEVQVIPWAVSDSIWVSGGGSARLAPLRTVFVGALHGMITAAGLSIIMNDLFPGVIYAGIDTDKNKYPIGSGRVMFNNVHSYLRAISAGFIEIRTEKFTKKVQVDPYLEDSMCSICELHQGPYFCRDPRCFGYFCRSCWTWMHISRENEDHKPMMRCSKSTQHLNSNNSNGLSVQELPALPALPTSSAVTQARAVPAVPIQDDVRSPVLNGRYSSDTSSPPTSGTSTDSAASAFAHHTN